MVTWKAETSPPVWLSRITWFTLTIILIQKRIEKQGDLATSHIGTGTAVLFFAYRHWREAQCACVFIVVKLLKKDFLRRFITAVSWLQVAI